MTNGAAALFMGTAYQIAAIYFGDTPLERKDTGHRGSGVARKQVDATKIWGRTQRARRYTLQARQPKFGPTAAELRTERFPGASETTKPTDQG